MFRPNSKKGKVLRTVDKFCSFCKKEHIHYDIEWEDGYRRASCPVFLMMHNYFEKDGMIVNNKFIN